MRIYLHAALAAVALYLMAVPAFAEPLTVQQAIDKAVAAAPALDADRAAIDAARAARLQAGLKPNDSITVETENFVGTGYYSVLEQAEVTASYNRTLERGGKRAARIALADSDIVVAEAAVAVARLELASQVQRAFLDVLMADQARSIAEQSFVIARGLQSEAAKRVAYAKDPLFVGTNADARLAAAKIAVDQAKRRQASARDDLASFWGATGEGLEVAGDPLALAGSITASDRLAEADTALSEAGIIRAGRQIDVERTRAVPDYTVSGGARFLRETNDVALIGSVTIPLGRRDRNQGNIARAEADKRRLEYQAAAQRQERGRLLAQLRRTADAAQARATANRTEIYPRVTRAMAQVQAGYARGGFTFRDMQDAADAIFEAQADYLDALATLRGAQAQLDRLTGRFTTTPSAELPR